MVMRVTIVRNAIQAWKYLIQDNYYSDHHADASFMGGKLAAEQGLDGRPVNKAVFADLLNGILGAEQIQRGAKSKNGEALESQGHRPATDLTFNASKSFSIAARMGGDTRLLQAQRQAVTAVMAYAERELAAARVTENGKTNLQSTGTMFWSAFHHDTSRNLEAHDHIHVLVMNMTRGPDGKLRALDNEQLFKQQMALGAMYHAELRRAVENLGYATRDSEGAKNGEWEIEGIDVDLMERKSSRRAAMLAYLARKGIDPEKVTAKQLDIAAKATRLAKDKNVDHAALAAEWRAEFQAAQPGWQAPVALTAEEVQARDADRRHAAAVALDWALAHHLEKNNVVTQRDIISTAAREARSVSVADLEAEFLAREMDGRLIFDADTRRYTTRDAQDRERDILQHMENGRSQAGAIMSQAEAEAFLQGLPPGTLNEGQLKAARLFLTSPDRYALIQGVAGAGKTHMLSTIRPALEAKGYTVVGLGPTHQAAGELREKMGKGVTLKSLLATDAEKEALNSKTIVILDEAGMVSASDMQEFLKAIDSQQARAFYIGDQRQFKAVEAGNPFYLLQQHGIAMAEMDETVRQKAGTELRRIVDMAASGNSKSSLEMLDAAGKVFEISDKDERYAAIADAYLQYSDTERSEMLILTGTNEGRRSLNTRVREGLSLAGKGAEITTYEKVDLTVAQRQKAKFYKPGQRLQFNKAYKSMSIEAQSILEIDRIERDKLILKGSNGKEIRFDPSKYDPKKWGVLSTEQMEFSVGDWVRFRTNKAIDGAPGAPREYEYHNNDKGVVRSLDQQAGTLEIFNQTKNSLVTLRLDEAQFLTHGYAMTGHSAQGATVNKVLLDLDAGSKTTTLEAFYTNLTRARQEALVFTSSLKDLLKAVERRIEKANALDIGAGRFSTTTERKDMDMHSQDPDRVSEASTSGKKKQHGLDASSDGHLPDPLDLADRKHPAILKAAILDAHLTRADIPEMPPEYREAGLSQNDYANLQSARQIREVLEPHLDYLTDEARDSIKAFLSKDAVSTLANEAPGLAATDNLDPFQHGERDQGQEADARKRQQNKEVAWLNDEQQSYMSREGNVWAMDRNGDYFYDPEATMQIKHNSPDEYRDLVERAGGAFNESGQVIQRNVLGNETNPTISPDQLQSLGLADVASSRQANLAQLESSIFQRGAWPTPTHSHEPSHALSL